MLIFILNCIKLYLEKFPQLFSTVQSRIRLKSNTQTRFSQKRGIINEKKFVYSSSTPSYTLFSCIHQLHSVQDNINIATIKYLFQPEEYCSFRSLFIFRSSCHETRVASDNLLNLKSAKFALKKGKIFAWVKFRS